MITDMSNLQWKLQMIHICKRYRLINFLRNYNKSQVLSHVDRFQSHLHDWSCLPHQLDAAALLLYVKYFPNHYTQFRLKLLQGQRHREHDSINNAWLSKGLDMRRGGCFFFSFKATTVSEEPTVLRTDYCIWRI